MPRLSKLKPLKGFTLLEVLVSIAIFSVISIGIYNVLIVGQRTFYTGLGTLELQSQIRMAVSWITRELREGTSFSITTVDADDDSITFSTPNEASIAYYRDVSDLNGDNITTQVIREYPSGTRKVVANDITSLEFSSSGRLVKVSLTAAKNSGGRQLQSALITNVETRNE